MRRKASTFGILHRYVLREFLLSFLVAFLFFFFIFFINQLLLLAQKILLKQVDFSSMVLLVSLAIPQILLYTLPFSSLTAASMVIGDLASKNEILAIRSAGISLREIFIPIILLSLLISALTFSVADVFLPYSSQRYKTLYAELLRDLPTMELDPYSVNKVGDKILVTGEVKDDTIRDLVLFDISNQSDSKVISASSGTVELVDLDRYIYRLELKEPIVLQTDNLSIEEFSLAHAAQMTYYLDFSNQITRFTDVTPSQLSTRDLLNAIAIRKTEVDKEADKVHANITALRTRIATIIRSVESGQSENADFKELIGIEQELMQASNQRIVNFYLQYYRAEMHKKFALSAGCFFLVFITFPLSFFRMKHGRLFGFGLSMFVACLYWFLLFFAQTKILDVSFSPGFLIWAPNAIVFSIALALLTRLRRV
ncbi:MAG: permease [Spirochaetae bacterium HGW-Spirochaetae-8]|jgi:lipopolysaccharide export system permease protein|nr:MAG: permease [Spirochaetae bacterium HGW-Spirochaetae-8]